MKKIIGEIEQALAAYPQRTSAHHPESYIGGGQSELKFLGLRAAHMQAAIRAGFSFTKISEDRAAAAWHHVWRHSDCFEVMALALAWFDHPKRRGRLRREWARLRGWSARVDNWAHADTLSGIYARILEEDPAKVYPTLRRWGRSRNPWLRRLSIVSLIYYSSQRKKVLPARMILPLVAAQIDYDHHYVQKGVGWVLRELGNVYPKEAMRFLEGNILRLSAPAFAAATEKLGAKQKAKLKGLRQGRAVKRK